MFLLSLSLLTACSDDNISKLVDNTRLSQPPAGSGGPSPSPTVSVQSQRSRYFTDVGILELQLGANYAAVSAFETALELDPKNDTAQKMLEEARKLAAQATPPSYTVAPRKGATGSSGPGSSSIPVSETPVPFLSPNIPFVGNQPFSPLNPIATPVAQGSPLPSTTPTATGNGATPTPTAAPPGCTQGDKLEFYLLDASGTGMVGPLGSGPGYPLAVSVGDTAIISFKSASPHVSVRLDGPFGPRFLGVNRSDVGFEWQWRIAPTKAGNYQYSFSSEGNPVCDTKELAVTGRWQRLSSGLPSRENFRVTTIQVSPYYPFDHTIYLGFDGSGVYRSTNADAASPTFVQLNGGLTSLSVSTLAISPAYATDRTLFVGTKDGGVFRSTNAGETWEKVALDQTSNANISAVALSPNFTTDKTVFAAVEGAGVYASFDGGSAWQTVNDGLPDLSVRSLVVSSNYSNDRTVHAGTRFSGVFKLSVNPNDGSRAQRISAAPSHKDRRLLMVAGRAWGYRPPYVPSRLAISARPEDITASAIVDLSNGECYNADDKVGLKVYVWAGDAADDSVFYARPGQQVSYKYEIKNIGNVELRNILVNDDNGTPNDAADDILVGVILKLMPLVNESGGLNDPSEAVVTLTKDMVVVEDTNRKATAKGFYGAQLTKPVSCSDNAVVDVVTPSLQLEMTVSDKTATDVKFQYALRNDGQVDLHNIKVIDDNGTPGTGSNAEDDVTIGTINVLKTGAEQSLAKGFTLRGSTTHTATAETVFSGETLRVSADASVSIEGPAGDIVSGVWTPMPASESLEALSVELLGAPPFFSNDRTIFAASQFGGLFMHDGQSWKKISEGFGYTWIRSMVVSPRFKEDGMVYLGTSNGVYRFDNKGKAWIPLMSGLPKLAPSTEQHSGITSVAISPDYGNDKTVFAGLWLDDIYRLID